MLSQDNVEKCKKCGEKYSDKFNAKRKWCKICEINHLRSNFTNWTSGNEEIDNLIKETQLIISSAYDAIFEWIPYDQFSNIREIDKDDSTKLYFATWKHGPLHYNENKYTRDQNKSVALKHLQNIDEV